ncbi:cysteine dioxygenase family protein [Stenotrophomonas sp. YIM B06876]|uniref:cysteine dioxygenase family protein n=1 Tax=Stenotrophomonas sp. YIM B06876 TaxID=3060211 RepID=UPI002738DC7C|nr:cysteine dioxygenase family protein [Stenotrophomonas sp. YIM B06876]
MPHDISGYPTFPGRDRLLAAIDHAVQGGDSPQVTAALQQVLRQAMADARIRLPGCVHQPVAGHYARRELYRSATHGYSIVAMTWGPGQATPLHDHAGLWCVEGVWSGALQVTRYELVERDGEHFRFDARQGLLAGPGSAGSLIPPQEYHTLCNPGREQVAVSVHVYQAALERCTIFVPDPDRAPWYLRAERALQNDGQGGAPRPASAMPLRR